MLKAQDVLVALKFASHRGREWQYETLSEELGLSYGVVFSAVRRAGVCGLVNTRTQTAITPALLEFLVHGVRYVFPAQRGASSRGIPTGPSAQPLLERIATSEALPFVWPHRRGSVRGESVMPLHKAVPEATSHDPKLYALLCVIDGVRIGGARVRAVAADLLKELLEQQ